MPTDEIRSWRGFCAGKPVAKARPRRVWHEASKRMLVITPKTTLVWGGRAARDFARQAFALKNAGVFPLRGPTVVNVELVFERPLRLKRKTSPRGRIPHVAKPDRDNLDKAALDALKDAGILSDDSIVFDGRITKWYGAINESAGVHVCVRWGGEITTGGQP